jgi:hypothetical protein
VTTAGIVAFVCVPMDGARLLRSACAARSRAATREARAGEPALRFPVCRGCVVGKAHDKGTIPKRWPDGSPIVEIRLTTHGSPPTNPAPAKRPKTKPARGSTTPTPPAAPIPTPPVVETSKPAPVPAEPVRVTIRGQLSLGLPGLTRKPEKGAEARAGGNTAATAERVVSGLLGGGMAHAFEGALDSDPEVSEPSRMSRRAGKAPRWIVANGIRDSVAGWARRLGVAHTVIAERLRRGWPEALAVTMPKGATMGAKPARVARESVPLSAYELARALDALRREGFEVERIGLSPRGDVLVIRTEERHAGSIAS